MKIILNTIKTLAIFILLTILTQVGGIIYLIYKPLSHRIKEKYPEKIKNLVARIIAFSLLMLLGSTLVIPPIAKLSGRVPLPIFSSQALKPVSLMLVLGNRHYVKPELKEFILELSLEIQQKYPNTRINYLDANFPFFDGFPLLPHRSHDDGEKLDISFLYKNATTNQRINNPPTMLGYGFNEAPKNGEFNQPLQCKKQGYWQYALLENFVKGNPTYKFDEAANQFLLNKIVKDKRIGKVFIEPHLKQRLGFKNENKIRFHGCGAVRHDDHIHLQL